MTVLVETAPHEFSANYHTPPFIKLKSYYPLTTCVNLHIRLRRVVRKVKKYPFNPTFWVFSIALSSILVYTFFPIIEFPEQFSELNRAMDEVEILAGRINPIGASWITAIATGILAFLTFRSVKKSGEMSSANKEMVELNRDIVKETRKERMREYIKSIIKFGLRKLKDDLESNFFFQRTARAKPMQITEQLGYHHPELKEWSIDLSEYPLSDIKRITPEDSELYVVGCLKDFKKSYEDYRRKRDRIKDEIQRSLSGSDIHERIDDTDLSSSGTAYKRKYSETEYHRKRVENIEFDKEEVLGYIEENKETITENIINNQRPINRYKVLYEKIFLPHVKKSTTIEEEIEELDDGYSDLKDQYQSLTANEGYYRGSLSIRTKGGKIVELINHLQNEYQILDNELEDYSKSDEESVEEENSKQTPSEDQVETRTVNIGKARVQLTDEDQYDLRNTIDSDDFEDYDAYLERREELRPGTEYDLVRIIPDGWVECSERYEMSDEPKHFVTLYPSTRIEKLTFHRSRSEVEKFD